MRSRKPEYPQLRNKTVCIDANVLMLFIVGSVDPILIKKYARTHRWDADAFYTLIAMTDGATLQLLQPILVEACDMLEGIPGCYEVLKQLVDNLRERHFMSRRLVNSNVYMKVGLADSSIIELARTGTTIITIDGPLTGLLRNAGYTVFNFNEILKSSYSKFV